MIGIDMSYIKRPDNGLFNGVDIFAAEIIDGLSEFKQDIIILAHPNKYLYFKKRFPGFRIIKVNKFYYSFRPPKLLSVIYRRFFLLINGIDKLWYPFTTYYNFKATGLPTICTIHDIIPVDLNPDNESYKKGYYDILKNKNNTVVVISEYIREHILSVFPDVQAKMVVIHNAVMVNDESQEIKELIDKKFILDINSYQYRKNPLTLLNAYILSGLSSEYHLVFCGVCVTDSCFDELQEVIKEHSLNDKVHIYLKLSDLNKNWLLNNAKLFVSPSKNEGFGRSPIEAAICKIPVITTKCTSLLEVTMGLLNYVNNPDDENELASLMINVLNNPPSEDELKTISDTYKEKYNIYNISKKYMDLFLN